MAFGPIMQVRVSDGLHVELAPLSREVMGEFVSPGMQQASITRYLSHRNGFVLEDEEEWYEKTRKETDSIVWGVYALAGDTRVLIGSTSIFRIERKHIHQGMTGSLLFAKEYWGRGIASAIHKARTWYAFQHLGLHRLKSAALQPNHGSRKALMKSGYEIVSVERNVEFVDGQLLHHDNMECLNPNEPFWTQWWHGERVPAKSRAARQRSREALDWARDNVVLL